LVKVFSEYARNSSVVNIFDFLALACKFLDNTQLKTVIKTKVDFSISKGNFDAVILTGLRQESANFVCRMLQNNLDTTGDV